MIALKTRCFSLPAALCAAGLLCAVPAHAGLFDDDIARKQIADLQVILIVGSLII